MCQNETSDRPDKVQSANQRDGCEKCRLFQWNLTVSIIVFIITIFIFIMCSLRDIYHTYEFWQFMEQIMEATATWNKVISTVFQKSPPEGAKLADISISESPWMHLVWRYHRTFRLKTWCKLPRFELNMNVGACGHLDDTTGAVWRHVMLFLLLYYVWRRTQHWLPLHRILL